MNCECFSHNIIGNGQGPKMCASLLPNRVVFSADYTSILVFQSNGRQGHGVAVYNHCTTYAVILSNVSYLIATERSYMDLSITFTFLKLIS